MTFWMCHTPKKVTFVLVTTMDLADAPFLPTNDSFLCKKHKHVYKQSQYFNGTAKLFSFQFVRC